jgi:uncharacterized protein YjbI with pentapeptide repeats
MLSEHLAILEQGVANWNEWRANSKRLRPDLSGADLAGKDLIGADFSEANLTNANLRGSRLEQANFTEAILNRAVFSHATATHAVFTDAIAEGAFFRHAHLEYTKFKLANLRGSLFNVAFCSGASFYFANLSEANLTRADFTYSNLVCAVIDRAELSFASFEGAALKFSDSKPSRAASEVPPNDLRVYFSRARNHLLASYDEETLKRLRLPQEHRRNRDGDRASGIKKLNFSGYDLSELDLAQAHLSGANLSHVNLSHAILRCAHLEGADLSGANCEYANFEGVDLNSSNLALCVLHRANLTDALLDAANLQGADFTDAIGLSFERLRSAYNYLLAIYNEDFAVNVLKLPRDHEDQYLAKRLDPAAVQGALEGAKLRGADLRDWMLDDISLAGADLTGSMLDGVNAIRADFSGAILEDASAQDGDFSRAAFRNSVLRRARFGGSKGLRLADVAGADLYGSELPSSDEIEAAINVVEEVSKYAWIRVGTFGFLCASSVLVALSASDRALIAPDGLLSVGVFSAAITGRVFFALTPPLIIGFFIYLHVVLQTVWDEVAKLPSVLPSGKPAEKCINPWLLHGMVAAYYKLNQERSLRSRVQEAFAHTILYALAPVTLTVLWARYLNCRDWFTAFAQVLTVSLSGFLAVVFFSLAKATLRDQTPSAGWTASAVASILSRRILLMVVSGVIGLTAFTASLTQIRPHSSGYSTQSGAIRMASGISNLVGIKPWLVIHDEIVSAPSNLNSGKGRVANLSGRDLSFCDARRSQIVGADLNGARLDNADLSGANLTSAELRGANLRGANLTGATLSGTDLRGADLTGALGAGNLRERGAITDR